LIISLPKIDTYPGIQEGAHEMKFTSEKKVFGIIFLLIISVLFVFSGLASAQQVQAVTIAPASQTAAGASGSSGYSSGQADIQQSMQMQQLLQPEQAQSQQPSAKPELLQQSVDKGKKKDDKQASQDLRVRTSSETISEFEQYLSGHASATVSTNIRQFGYDLFSHSPSSFAPVEKVPVGPDYVMGPGDEIRITIWGKIDGYWTLVVDRDGNLNIPKVGIIGVTGLTFKELKETLYSEISKYYTGFDMNVSMGSLRTINVYMVGNAQRPGAYTVSSLSTLVNALFAAGGPSKTGTMRDIQVKRNGQTVVHFDMYDFLLSGDKSKDVRLMPEDVIFIPPIGQLVGIAGNVKTPAIYELRGESRLLDILAMTGGLSNIAFRDRVQVLRIENHRFRMIFEGDLKDVEANPEKNFSLADGDLIKVYSVVEAKTVVTLTGAVPMPGDYGVTSGVTRLKDVITKAGGLLYFASDKAELTRVKVTQAGPVTERMIVDLGKAMKGDAASDIPLEINDYIFVRMVPEWKLYRIVDVQGEVMYPGTYTVMKGERISSLIERAGGYTDRAYLRAAFFTRPRVKELQQKGLDEMILRLERELLSEGSVQDSASQSAEVLQAKKSEMENKLKFVEALKKLKATGRMSIKLADVALLKGSEYDFELEEGDRLLLPAINSVVNVTGSVMSMGSYIYLDKYDYTDYIGLSGGYSRYADTGQAYVMKVDGSARKLSGGLFSGVSFKSRWERSALGENVKEIEPGDTIVVPEKLERIAWLREIKDITQILMQIAVTSGVLLLMR
jgi:protein involved in polysaccharide export with SLBB domain